LNYSWWKTQKGRGKNQVILASNLVRIVEHLKAQRNFVKYQHTAQQATEIFATSS
jgi:hypothetical protein